MNVVYGLLGGFLIMGSVGGLEQDTMSIAECLMWATVGFGFAGLAIQAHI